MQSENEHIDPDDLVPGELLIHGVPADEYEFSEEDQT